MNNAPNNNPLSPPTLSPFVNHNCHIKHKARNINKSLKKPLEGNFLKASIDEITYLSAIAVSSH